jgi:hypothetical protein
VGQPVGSTATSCTRPWYHAAIPGQSATAHGDEHRVQVRRLLVQLKADSALPGQGRQPVVGVHVKGSGDLRTLLAGFGRLRIAGTGQDRFRSRRADPGYLDGGSRRRHIHLGGDSQRPRGVADCETVIAA